MTYLYGDMWQLSEKVDCQQPLGPLWESESRFRGVALFYKIELCNFTLGLSKTFNKFWVRTSLKATQCYYCIVNVLQGDVKRTAEQREKLLILLSKEAMEGFWKASVKASQMIAAVVDEVQYVFLKRMCQVLVHLGTSQLGALWVRTCMYVFVYMQ